MKKEITNQKAENLLKDILNKPCFFRLLYAGVLNIEIKNIKEVQTHTPGGKPYTILQGDYSLFVERDWKVYKDDKLITTINYQNEEEEKFIKQMFANLSKFIIKKIAFTDESTKIWFEEGYTIEILKGKDEGFSDWYLNFSKDDTCLICSNGKFFLENKTPA